MKRHSLRTRELVEDVMSVPLRELKVKKARTFSGELGPQLN